MKKQISILMVMLFVLTTLSACAGNEAPVDGAATTTDSVKQESEVTTAAPEIENPAAVSALKEQDLGGFTLRIACIDQQYVNWSNTTLTVENMSGDILNDVIYKRNAYVSETYHCNIEVKRMKKVGAALDKYVNANEDAYDLYMDKARDIASTSAKGYLVDVNELPQTELDKVWWDQAFLRDTAVGDTSYMLIGDLALTTADCLYTIIYNRKVAKDYGITNDELYQLVYDGKWTMDKMSEYAAKVTGDVNGDGAMDFNDRYGIIGTPIADPVFAFIMGCGGNAFHKNADGMPQFVGGGEKFLSLYERVNDLFNGDNFYDYASYTTMSNREAIRAMFESNRVLFVPQVLSAGAQYLREGDIDFGYLPMPKGDENQENYFTHVNMGAPVFVIPKTNSHLDQTSVVLEALCYYSYQHLMPEYYGTCFSVKYVPDEDSANMVKIAYNTKVYELGFVWKWGDFMNGIADLVKQDMLSAGSYVEKISSKVESEIAQTVSSLKG